jgi:hypothetical protein
VDSTFFEDVRNFFSSQDVKKELVDPYVIFSFGSNSFKSNWEYGFFEILGIFDNRFVINDTVSGSYISYSNNDIFTILIRSLPFIL